MWPVIRRTSVPPTEMSKDHRPHHNSPTGGVARPARRRWERQPQLNKLDLMPLVTEWSAAPVHRRCLTDCHRQRWSDDCRIPRPVPGCDSIPGCDSTTAPQAREIPRPAPDARSEGTLKWGGVVREERPRPTILCTVPHAQSSARQRGGVAFDPGHVRVTVTDRPKVGQPVQIRCLQRELQRSSVLLG
jgi:hypothetical protein